MNTPESKTLSVDGVQLHYLTAGEGPAVLLLHGWPTSSFLWREVIGPLSQKNRVLALDLPGFGRSDKPLGPVRELRSVAERGAFGPSAALGLLDVPPGTPRRPALRTDPNSHPSARSGALEQALDASYSFRFFARVLDGFLQKLGIEDIGLVVHDLGGPIGLYWAVQNLARVRSLALLNTVVYPQFSWAVVAFVAASRIPGLRALLASPRGLAWALKIGLADRSRATPEVIQAVQEPFKTQAARKALLKTGHSLHPGGFREIEQKLPAFRGPVRIIYGAKDWILPDVAKTMARVKKDLPQAEVTRLADCGHFLQEERGAEIGALLGAFFGQPTPV